MGANTQQNSYSMAMLSRELKAGEEEQSFGSRPPTERVFACGQRPARRVSDTLWVTLHEYNKVRLKALSRAIYLNATSSMAL